MRIINKLLSLFLFFLLISISYRVYAACNCTGDWYECGGGDMCCYGSGCPSAACDTTECLEWVWVEPKENCTPARWENYWGTCEEEHSVPGTCTGTRTITHCDGPYLCQTWTETYTYTCYHTETSEEPCQKTRYIPESCEIEDGYSKCVQQAPKCDSSGCYRCSDSDPTDPTPGPIDPPKTNCSFTVKAWERPLGSDSCDPTATNRSGMPVQVCTLAGSCPSEWRGTTDSNGNFIINSIEAIEENRNLVVTFGLYEEGGFLYGVVCPEQKSIYDVEFLPEGGLVCFDTTVTVGTQQLPTDPWFTSLSGDIFANTISTDPFDTATVFKPNLISEYNNLPGYALAKDLITVEDERTAENAGFVFNLSESAFDHNDIGLGKYRFSPPKHDEVADWPSGDDFSANSVYQIGVADFNHKLGSDITYSIGDNTAVLFVTGTNTLDIQNSITTSDSGRLIIVVEGDVNIRKEVGYTDTTGYGQDSTPNIMAGIIAQGNISFETEGTAIGSDAPIMVQAPFVSLGTINLERNLGIDNMDYPAVAAKYYSDYLYKLTKLERDSETVNYTGIQTFDVQFVYQD